MEKIGAAIVGIGRIGQVHLKNMVECRYIKLLWMVDNKPIHSKLEELVNLYSLHDTNITTPDDIQSVLTDDRVKMVVICVPTSFHKEFILKALKAGKHVFCEKPLCITVKDVIECYGEANKQNRILLCGLNRRFDKQFSEIYNLSKNGDFGQLRTVRMEGRDTQANLEYFVHNKGGIFLDMGIHDVDYVSWLINDEPDYCTAMGSNTSTMADGFKSYGEYDTVVGLIKFKSGVMAQIELYRGTCSGYQQSVMVTGSKKMARTTDVRESQIDITDEKGTHLYPYYLVDGFLDRYLESFAEEMNHFVRTIQGKEECIVTAESVILSTKLVYMLTEALQTGEKVCYKNK